MEISKVKMTDTLKREIIRIVDERVREVHITRDDFSELKGIVKELAEAQKQSEKRLTRLEQVVEALTEAQKNSELRLTRLEKAVEELTEAQIRTEQRVNELAEAQKKTEQAIQKLTQEQIKMKEEIGGLSHTVGYRLEDEAMKSVPELLKHDLEVEVVGKLKRDYIEIGRNKYIEVNIFGNGRKDGKEYVIIGEAKSQLKKKNIDEFLKKAEILKRHIPKEQILLYITYISHPQTRRYAEEKNIRIYHSYEL